MSAVNICEAQFRENEGKREIFHILLFYTRTVVSMLSDSRF